MAYPHLADNPVHRAAPMLSELVSIEWDKGNEFFPPTSMQIANVKAGTGSNNVIPGDCFVQFNFRFSTELTDEMIKARVIALLEKYQLRYTVDWWLSGQPFLTQRGKLVDAVVNAIEHYNEIKPQLLTTGGTSDGRFIARMGAQVVELGPVNATIHKINECKCRGFTTAGPYVSTYYGANRRLTSALRGIANGLACKVLVDSGVSVSGRRIA